MIKYTEILVDMEFDDLNKLIQELCPDGVEFVKLGEVCEVLRGRRLTKKQLSDKAEYPVYHGGIQPIGFYSESNRPSNTVMIINVGASAGTIGFCEQEFWSSDGCYCLSHVDNVSPRYLYFVLSKDQHYFQSKVRHGGIPTLDALVVKNYKIPLPPIEVQTEIVRILDQVSRVSAELEAELESRKKQYRYISKKVLTFGDEVKWKKLGEVVASLKKGTLKTSDLIKDGKYKVINGGYNLYGYYDKYNNEANAITISSRGSAGFVSYFDEPFWAGGLCYPYRSKNENKLITKFLYYFLKYNEKKNINKLVVTGSIPALNKNTLEQLLIPIPSLEKQQEIVSILDPLDRYINSITKGLPAEIKLRKFQYKFIRDKLLTFKRK